MSEAITIITLILLAPTLIKFIDRGYDSLRETKLFKDLNS